MTEVQFAKQFLTTLDSKSIKYQPDYVFDPKTFEARVPYTLPKLSHPLHPLPPKPESAPTSTPAPGSESITSTLGTATTTVDLTLRSSRNPTFTLHLPSLPPTTPISTLKTYVQNLLSPSSSSTQVLADKIKILHNKKPIPANKPSIRDVIGDASNTDGVAIEFGVMVMGGAPDPNPPVQTLNLNNDVVEPNTTSADVGPESEKAAAEAASVTSSQLPPVQRQQPQTQVPIDTIATEKLSKQKSPNPVQPGEISGRQVLQTEEFWDDLQGFLEQRLRSSEVALEIRKKFEGVLR